VSRAGGADANPEGRLERVRRCIREAAAAGDRRFSRLDITASDPGGTVVLDGVSNSEAMLRDLLSRLAREGIEADDRGVELLDRNRPPAEIVPVSAVVHLRDEPDPRSALLTQAVLGEPLDLMARRGGWFLARTGDGYLGWVRGGGLAEPGEEYRLLREGGAEARVRVREVLLREAPDEGAVPVREAVFDSRLM
jgi:hypothetical protein